MANLSFQQARRLETLVNQFEGRTDLDATQQRTLDQAKQILSQSGDVAGQYGAAYRGFGQGVSLRGLDELRALGAGIIPGGENYDQALETQRMRNLEAQTAFPQEYAKGETAGMIGTSGAAMAVPTIAARNLPIAGQMALGAVEGGLLAATPEFLGGEGGFGPRMANVSGATVATGAGLGVAAPVIGGIAGLSTRAIQNMQRNIPGYGARASQVAARGIGRTVDAGVDIPAYVRSIGKEGMLADVPGGPQAQAMGLAAQQGAGGTTVSRAIESRATGAEDRITQEINRIAGEPNAAFNQRRELAAERSGVLGPEYEIAISNRDMIDVSGIVSGIDSLATDAVGTTAARLNRFKRLLTTDDGTMSAARLHNIRTQVSDTLQTLTQQGQGGAVRNLRQVLQSIDDRLDTLPGYTEARTGYANNKEMERQIEEGRSALAGGPASASSPDELRASFSRLSEAQKEAYRAGVREYIGALMGTSRNAPATAWTQLNTGYNTDKLRIIFGDDAASDIINTLRGERVFSETRGRVNQGSMTEMRSQAAEDLGPVVEPGTGRRPGPIQRVRNTLSDATNSVIDSILYGSRTANANAELGQILSLTGEERDAAINALMLEAQAQRQNTRAQNAVNTLIQLGFKGSIPAVTSQQ